MPEAGLPEELRGSNRFPVWAWVAIGAAVLIPVGIVLVGLAAVFVVPSVMQKHVGTWQGKARVDVITIDSALLEYSIANRGQYPESLEALVTQDVNGHTYLATTGVPKDPWRREYRYDPPGAQSKYRVYTLGRDGVAGGEGDDADIDNWDLRRAKR